MEPRSFGSALLFRDKASSAAIFRIETSAVGASPGAGSLAMAKGAPIDRLAFYRAFLLQFEMIYRRFRQEGLGPLLPDYRRRSLLLGNKVVVRQGRLKISGVAVAIDDSGGLVIKHGKKETIVHSGEATLR